ncbi:MAG: hypothetical protein LBI69_04655 [Puniceicoccales bacterium]|nr:hypothetical protein [Puniceicoccales bacterium]
MQEISHNLINFSLWVPFLPRPHRKRCFKKFTMDDEERVEKMSAKKKFPAVKKAMQKKLGMTIEASRVAASVRYPSG